MKEGKENVEDSSAPLIEHLTELRQRLIFSGGFHSCNACLFHNMETYIQLPYFTTM